MTRLIPEKLHVTFLSGASPNVFAIPRYYTLTHSDRTGDLFLSVGSCYDSGRTSKLYTRVMRDEVLAELKEDHEGISLNVHCHVSGGFVFGTAKWRYGIFCSELPLVLEAMRFGDRTIFESDPKLDQTPVLIAFKSKEKKYNKTERWGVIGDYKQ